MEKKSESVLRSSFSLDGTRIFLVHVEGCQGAFRLATRWRWLAKFESIHDACDAFEALEMMEGDLARASRAIKAEIRRVPRHSFGRKRASHSRISYLVRCSESRAAGLRLKRCGSKGSVEYWQ